MAGLPSAASYKFNSFQEIKSHSSILYNERMAILFYLLDMNSIEMNTHNNVQSILKVRAVIMQIYKNIRTLLRNNPTCRATLNLDTKEEGIYTTDMALGIINKMVQYCETTGYTSRSAYMIADELNKLEVVIKDILQYFSYFIRPDFHQKPDIEIATERYKEIADARTIDELKNLAGKKHHIDFEGLGSSRVELKNDYSEEVEEEEEPADEG
jgi:hypothetical protein